MMYIFILFLHVLYCMMCVHLFILFTCTFTAQRVYILLVFYIYIYIHIWIFSKHKHLYIDNISNEQVKVRFQNLHPELQGTHIYLKLCFTQFSDILWSVWTYWFPDMPELQHSNNADMTPLRPVFTPTVERTRDFSVKPLPAGLRYGNFGCVRTLPHVGRGHVAGQHFVPYFNNQQLFRKVWEWFESWTPWQQKMLLCGLTNRWVTVLFRTMVRNSNQWSGTVINGPEQWSNTGWITKTWLLITVSGHFVMMTEKHTLLYIYNRF